MPGRGEADIFHSEDRARAAIDAQLAQSGWAVQSREQMNLGAGPGVAVREFATESGPVDYALFVGRTLCGAIEAKPEGTTLSGFSQQAERYMADMPSHLVRQPGQVRFEYVTSQRETLFRDHADPASRSRPIFAFHRPLKERPMVRADLDDFVACYRASARHGRVESERFRRFGYDELAARDKATWTSSG